MTAWLYIIGVGDDGLASLNEAAKTALADATLIIGGERHLHMLPADDARPKMSWPSPLIKLVNDVMDRRGEKIAILATGDPMHYGIGVTFAKRLPPEEMTVFPSLSAFSLAASRLGWDLSKIVTMTLHGRPLELIIPSLNHSARILALSDNGETPSKLATLLAAKGYGESVLTVLEHMGGAGEKITTKTASQWIGQKCQDLNTVAIECAMEGNPSPLTTIPGLPDDAFIHDGQLTKKEVRATTLAALNPLPGQMLWDVGAGSGSISIEWMRISPLNQAIAIEHKSDRLELISKNSLHLGVPGLKIISGKAPDALDTLADPDRIFIGGGLTNDGVFEACWRRLKTGGILVANTVTTQGEGFAFTLAEKHDGELTRLNYSRAVKIGDFTSWKPFKQVTQLRLVKK